MLVTHLRFVLHSRNLQPSAIPTCSVLSTVLLFVSAELECSLIEIEFPRPHWDVSPGEFIYTCSYG